MPAPRIEPLPLAILTGILAMADGGLTAIALLVANARREGDLSAAEAATFLLVGVSAAAGVIVLILALIALSRGRAGRSVAQFASVTGRLARWCGFEKATPTPRGRFVPLGRFCH